MDELQRLLEAFSKRYGTQGYLMKARIEILMKQGKSPEDAVRQVFQEFGVEDWLQVNVAQVIVGTAQHTLGKEAASTLSTAAILEALSNPWDGSGLTLSEKIHGASNVMLNDVISTLRDQIRRNKTVKDTAQALYDGYKSGHVVREQQLPKYLDELTRWTKVSRENLTQEEQQVLQKAIRKVKYQADDLVDDRVTYNHFRTSLRELMDKLENGSQKAAQRALQNAIQEKSRYVAERIARTEAARARYDTFIANYGEDEDVVAYKWKLGSRHPAEDICDMYANADLYGLGKGIFPKDKVVPQPAHPHCLCHYAPVYWGEIDEKKRSDNVEENGRAWLEKQPLHIRQAILGVKGEQEWQAGRARWMEKARNLSDMFGKTESRISLVNEVSRKQRWGDFNQYLKGQQSEEFSSKYNVNWSYIKSVQYNKNFEGLPFSQNVKKSIRQRVMFMLKNKDGCNGEQLFALDAETGIEIARITNQHYYGGVYHDPPFTDRIEKAYDEGKKLLFLHNHPLGFPPSWSDINGLQKFKGSLGLTFGHTGSIYLYGNPESKIPIEELAVAQMHSKSYNEIEKQEFALNVLKDKFNFVFDVIGKRG